MSLSGKEMTTGGSIIMPMEIRPEATTISSTKSGIYSRNPI
jgi:hypothetical protein